MWHRVPLLVLAGALWIGAGLSVRQEIFEPVPQAAVAEQLFVVPQQLSSRERDHEGALPKLYAALEPPPVAVVSATTRGTWQLGPAI